MYFNGNSTQAGHPVSLNWCSKCMTKPISFSSHLCENHLGTTFDSLVITPNHESKSPKLSFESLAKFEIDSELCFDAVSDQRDDTKTTKVEVSDMAYTKDGHLILCCNGTRSIQTRRSRMGESQVCQKLLKYTEKGKYVTQCQLDESPRKICLMPTEDQAVVTLGQKIQFVSLPDMSLGKSVMIGTDCTGIAIVNRMIYVGDSSKLHVLDQIGRLFKTIDAPCIPNSIHLNKDGRLYCATGTAVCCMTPDASFVYSYNSSDLGQVNSITSDMSGNIYVAGSELQMFYPYESKIERIFRKEDGVGIMRAICFNDTFTKMFVANNGKDITIYTCK